jgi:hypothetical protein
MERARHPVHWPNERPSLLHKYPRRRHPKPAARRADGSSEAAGGSTEHLSTWLTPAGYCMFFNALNKVSNVDTPVAG